jgi:hypothetical protein
MSFIIQGLDPALFGSLYDQKQAKFNKICVEYHDVTEEPGFPCRVTLADARIGERVLLISYTHLAGTSPYGQSGPIFVTEHAQSRGHYVNAIPPALASRLLSLRAYDHNDAMIDATVVEGRLAKDVIDAFFDNPSIAKIDAHNAVRGCFAAHIMRA